MVSGDPSVVLSSQSQRSRPSLSGRRVTGAAFEDRGELARLCDKCVFCRLVSQTACLNRDFLSPIALYSVFVGYELPVARTCRCTRVVTVYSRCAPCNSPDEASIYSMKDVVSHFTIPSAANGQCEEALRVFGALSRFSKPPLDVSSAETCLVEHSLSNRLPYRKA